ncbi:alpha/beta fold hydrolase [Nocardia sp. NBC_01327]|uniref:alpha/beta fold hydrolase n=1 Tax=Nocardia sp. NBC_01327 TaxID=2903593 RepID=UPI002E10DA6B|nr:alpha/beta hydrolase [Nocardia sp. NBC_01327]
MNTIETATLQVPGAELYYEIRGAGPMLLISQSGEGDARRSEDLVRRLESDFTVVTYDRRGLSHSRIHDSRTVTVATHADDVHRLLSEVADGPVRMLGCSLGASIGLHMATTHPEQLQLLIAHEPVSPWLLAATDRALHMRELEHCQQVYRAEGWQAALAPMARTLGINPADQEIEPNVRPIPITAERAANFGYFIEHDFTAVREDWLDALSLQQTEVQIVPAQGRHTPHQVFDRKCATELSKLLNTPVAEFPGGHNGNLTHPTAYADQVRTLITTTHS